MRFFLPVTSIMLTMGALMSGAAAQIVRSVHWSGFYTTPSDYCNDLGGSGCKFIDVQGVWVVPTITYIQGAGGDENVSTWIGFGGINDATIVQVGTSQAINNAGTTYVAWYEFVTNGQGAQIPITTGPIMPGDQISASIACDSPGTCNSFEIILGNQTRHWTFDQSFNFSYVPTTAEWVVEAPCLPGSNCGAYYPLPRFTPVTFQDPWINTNRTKLSFALNPIVMRDNGSCSQSIGCSTPCTALVDNSGFAIAISIDYGPKCTSPTVARTHDFDGDGNSDMGWGWADAPQKEMTGQSASNAVAVWLMDGNQVLQAASVASVPNTWSVVGERDFDGDGKADLLWRDTAGDLAIWFMNGIQVSAAASLGNLPANWNLYGTGDLNGDGKGDLLWRNDAGDVAIWFMNGSMVTSAETLGNVPMTWNIKASDAVGDIIWQDASGDLAIWKVTGTQTQSASLGNLPANWQVVGMGDFDGDGSDDILLRDSTTGSLVIWFVSGNRVVLATNLGVVPTSWRIAETGDYNGDGMSDILWEDGSGNIAVWFMNASQVASTASLGNLGTGWQALAQNGE